MNRMWQLIEEAKRRPLTDLEKTELQAFFIRVAYNGVRALAADGEGVYE
jgi:hypothetical protein